MTWAWIHREAETITVCPIAILFDWRENLIDRLSAISRYLENAPDDLERAANAAGFHRHPVDMDFTRQLQNWGEREYTEDDINRMTKATQQYLKIPTEREAMRALVKHCYPVPCNHAFPILMWLHSMPTDDAQRIARSSIDDLDGEYPFMLAFIIMLNAKGAVDNTKEDLSRLNTTRTRRGRRPLREFMVTTLHLDKTSRNVGKARGLSQEAIRRHLVRGHFKTRKTGIYWWSPFLRGHGDTVMRERYAVRG
jgi:hypothetical protein